MATRLSNPAPQYFYNGTPAAPLAGGKMYFYEVGESLTPKNTYADNGLTTANSNPVILSSSGVLPNVFLDGSYRVILKDKNGVQQWDRDSINAIIDLAFADYDPTFDYGVGGTNIVYASNGIYYISIQTPNIGNSPSTSPAYWEILIDYLFKSQSVVGDGRIAIGDATTGLAGLDTTPKGTIAVGDGTTTVALTVGADGTALFADSAEDEGVKWQAIPAIEALATVTATAASSALLNTNIDATYSAYDLIIMGTASAIAALSLRVELGGSVISSSTYIYGHWDQSSAGATAAWIQAPVGTPVSAVPIYSVDSTATSSFYLKVRILNPASTTLMKQVNIQGSSRANSGNVSWIDGVAMNTGTAALTGIQIFPASGTITCTMNLYPANVA